MIEGSKTVPIDKEFIDTWQLVKKERLRTMKVKTRQKKLGNILNRIDND